MNEEPAAVQPAAPAQPPAPKTPISQEIKYLKEIAMHLESIRGMLKFFTLILVMYIILSILGSLVGF